MDRQAGKQVAQDLPVTISQHWDYVLSILVYYLGPKDLNLGLCACNTTTLPTELHL